MLSGLEDFVKKFPAQGLVLEADKVVVVVVVAVVVVAVVL